MASILHPAVLCTDYAKKKVLLTWVSSIAKLYTGTGALNSTRVENNFVRYHRIRVFAYRKGEKKKWQRIRYDFDFTFCFDFTICTETSDRVRYCSQLLIVVSPV